MQTPEERKYWANRRKADRTYPATKLPEPRKEIVLLATSMTEYEQIKRDNPSMKVRLEIPEPQQAQLFATQEFVDV